MEQETMKTCCKCNEPKELSEFGIQDDQKLGVRPDCKGCRAKYMLVYRELNKEKLRINKLAWQAANKEHIAARSKVRYQADKDSRLQKQYNITLAQYNQMFANQEGRCPICTKHQSELECSLCVDHDHTCCPGKTSCGKCVRGLLCKPCNAGLGYFKDNPEYLMKAATYVTNV